MRSKSYKNYTDSFTPLQPNEMLRLSLVEGIKGKYPEGQRKRYKRLLKKYLRIDNYEIDILSDLFSRHHDAYDAYDGANDEKFNQLLNKVSYNSTNWRNINYNNLKNEGVIIEYSGNKKGLAELLELTDQRKVISYQKPGFDKKMANYLKHIPWQNKLVLNGPDVIMDFAKAKGFYEHLPESLPKARRVTNKVRELLREFDFSFSKALKTSINHTLKSEKYANREIRTFTIKNPNGSELRLHQYNPVEAAEHFVNVRKRKIFGDNSQEVYLILGNKESELDPERLYHGTNKFKVPKRIPTQDGKITHNTLETHFLPTNESNDILEYFNTVTFCDCPHSLNLRNFQERRGSKTYVIPTFDIHASMVSLEILARQGIDARNPANAENNLSPLPSEETVYFLDKAKYNLFIQQEQEDSNQRKPADKLTLDLLCNERAKLRSFSHLYMPSNKLKDFVCKDMYLE
ncbi:MAG: hypothetical protein ACQESF_05675 [Nanobdellota archaeon]